MSKPNSRRSFSASQLQERLLANPALAAANPGLSIEPTGAEIASQRPASTPLSPPEGKDSGKPGKAGKKRKEMNQTEREFAMMLQKRVDSGEIVSFSYEAITLRMGEGAAMMAYTPDFLCIEEVVIYGTHSLLKIKFIEVKGSHIWAKDLVKLKAAITHFKGIFEFELHQKKNREWTRLI